MNRLMWFRAVSTEEAEAVANEKNFIFQEVSAKTGSGINTLFQQEIYGRIARVLNLGDEPVQTERRIDLDNLCSDSAG